VDLRRATHSATRIAAIAALVVLGASSVGHASTPPAEPAAGDQLTPSDAGNFAVQPSGGNGPGGRDYFVYTLKVGEVYGDTVAISNLGTETATYAIYATDAQNTTDGSFSLLREEDEPTDVGSWVELGATQWTVEPGTRVDIPFRVTVPADVAPGDHVGAIVAQKIDDPDNPNDGIGLDVRVRIGARLYVRVDGPVNPSIAIDDFTVSYSAPASPFSGADAHVNYTLTNTGDIRLAPIADLSIAGAFGLGEQALPQREIPELLPGGSVEIAEVIHDVKPYIRISADLTVVTGETAAVANSSITQWAVPAFAVATLVLVVLVLVLWRVMKRRRASA
jgi:uncharacterized membrane protein